MTNRILDFSETPVRLRVDTGRILVTSPEGVHLDAVPLTDIESVLLSQPAITLTQAVLSQLAEAGVPAIVCDSRRRPVGMLLPLEAHQEQRKRFLAQCDLPAPRQKRLWQTVVRAKIAAQAGTLQEIHGVDFGIGPMARRVGSGDPNNVEAQAARRYWLALFPEDRFRRRDEEDARNHLLDYGYAVLRSSVARALCASGLHPSLSIHHRAPFNTFPLADDLMEPFRPAVDRAVYLEASRRLDAGEPLLLDPAAKKALFAGITARYRCAGESRTLFDLITRACQSFAAALLSPEVQFVLPPWQLDLRKDVSHAVSDHVDLRNVRSAG